MEMLMEGVPPAFIENAGRMTGMPRGPLELRDDVGIDLTVRVAQQTRAALGDSYVSRPYESLLESMVKDGRTGRTAGAGFYDYPQDGAKRVWSGLESAVKSPKRSAQAPSLAEIKMRLLHRQALEAARCFGEGVITDSRAADVAAIFAWGFAPWTGGPLSYIDGLGVDRFVAECDQLAEKYGERFAPPKTLNAMKAARKGFYR
jgi:3-hydroxyacyl-CoA dehydrogenase/enoyl-CoA hydratase/3-hydroxybutyryl-CoA epimerase